MKKSISSKVLAAFLALVMVLSTMIVAPFSSFAGAVTISQSDLALLDTACDNFNNAITQMANANKVYKNLSGAYAVYLDAREYRDLAQVGENDGSQAAAKAQALDNVINGFTAYDASTVYTLSDAAADGSYNASTLVGNDKMANVLYTYGVGSNASWTDATRYNNVLPGVQYGSVVFLYTSPYDEMAVPVNGYWGHDVGALSTNKRVLRYMNEDSDDFTIKDYWHGETTNTGYQTGTSHELGLAASPDKPGTKGTRNKNYYYSTTLYYTGTLGANEATKTILSISWKAEDNRDKSQTWSHNTPIYVVNLNAVTSRLDSAAAKLQTISVNEMNSANAAAFFAGVDALTNVNLKNYNFASDTAVAVSNAGTAITNAITAYDNAQTVNKAGLMRELGATVASFKDYYDATNNSGTFTAESWTAFTNAYNAAFYAIKNAGTGGYTLSEDAIKTLIDNLKNAKLEYANTVADVSKFNEVRYYVTTLTASYFTPESLAIVNAALDNATNIIYPNGITGEPISDKYQDDVDAATDSVWTAVKSLRINTTELQNLIATASGIDTSKYVAGDLNTAIGAAQDYVTNAANSDFPATASNHANAQNNAYNAYIAAINDLQKAIDSLQLAFTAITDGTIVNTTYASTGGNYDSSGKDLKIYLNNAITHRTYFKTATSTTREKSTFVTDYDVSIDNGYNMAGTKRGAQLHGLGWSAYGADNTSVTSGTFGVRWIEQAGGLDRAPTFDANLAYHDALMKTPDNYPQGSNFLDVKQDSKGQKLFGETTLTIGNINTTTITATDYVSPDLYALAYINPYLNNGGQYTFTVTDAKQTITVIEIAPLFRLIEEADVIDTNCSSNYFGCYTTASWERFSNALDAAKLNMDYTNMSNEAIVNECTARFNELTAAKNALTIDQDVTHHNYNPETYVAPTCTKTGSGTCLCCGFTARAIPALGHTYVYTPVGNGSQHTITCERDDISATTENCIDSNGDDICDICEGPIYDPADWSAYDAAKAELFATLDSGILISSLKENKDAIEALSYLIWSDARKATIPYTMQYLVDAETATIQNIIASLIKADSSAYDAIEYMVATLNADAYDVAAVRAVAAGANVSEVVEIEGTNYTGYYYDDAVQSIKTAMNENRWQYTITVYDLDEEEFYLVNDGTGQTYVPTGDYTDEDIYFYYGDLVTAYNPYDAEAACGWDVEITAQTTNTSSARKYALTDTDYQFNVRGNTNLYTTATETEDVYKVTFVDSRTNKVVYVTYTDGASVRFTNCPFPEYPYYEIASLTNAATGETKKANGNTGKLTDNVTYIINYELVEDKASFDITFIDLDGTTTTESYNYNDQVTFTSNGAAAFIDTDTDKVLFYGSTYTFYACQDIEIKAVAEAAQDAYVSVIKTPVVADANGNTRAFFIGSYALPEGCTVKSYGIVLDIYADKTDLSLADVDGMTVYNLSGRQHTAGNQFVLGVSFGGSTKDVQYVAYTIYEDANGVEHYVYSDIMTAYGVQA